MIAVLDLFCGAAGGWSLGLHRAGFATVAACESDPMRRAVFLQNFPGTRMYDDVRRLTGEQLLADLGYLPDIIVGSPPCQDASAANTKGKGVDGARTGLFFDALRLVRECRPRWCAFENSPRLRTRGGDRLIAGLEADGYAPWPHVVGADHVGANHERKRLWLVAADATQIGQPWLLRAPPGQWRRQVEHAAGAAPGAAADAKGTARWSGLSAARRGDEPADLSRDASRIGSEARCDTADAEADEKRLAPGRAASERRDEMLTPTATANLTAQSMLKWAGARALAKMLAAHGLSGTAALPVTYGWMLGFPPGWLARATLQVLDAQRAPLAS